MFNRFSMCILSCALMTINIAHNFIYLEASDSQLNFILFLNISLNINIIEIYYRNKERDTGRELQRKNF